MRHPTVRDRAGGDVGSGEAAEGEHRSATMCRLREYEICHVSSETVEPDMAIRSRRLDAISSYPASHEVRFNVSSLRRDVAV